MCIMNAELIENIWLRKDAKAGKKQKNIKTGLVVQGGGMRGIYSMAALMAFEELGLGKAFDHILGSSAGAINGAYFLAGQAKLAVTVYLDDISNRNFINFLRFRKIADIDFLVDVVLQKKKHLDVDKVISSSSTLHIILTDFKTGEAAVFTNKDRDIDIMELIRATASMPVLYNRVHYVNGRGYIDGGISDAIPLLKAIELGCTDIVVVLTRSLTFRRKRPGIFLRVMEFPFMRKYPDNVKNTLLLEDQHFNCTMDYLENPAGLGKDVRVLVIYPSNMHDMVSRTTKSRSDLLNCALMGRNDARNALMLDPLDDNPFGC